MDSFKSRLYANITHEFRTPLTVILGMAERLESSGGIQPGAGAGLNPAATIRRNGENLLRLVNQILDLSKLEAGAMALHPQRGDAMGFVKYLLEAFQSLAAGKDVRLHFQSEIEECEMDFDAEKLQQVESNLLSNAIKFTPEGGEG